MACHILAALVATVVVAAASDDKELRTSQTLSLFVQTERLNYRKTGPEREICIIVGVERMSTDSAAAHIAQFKANVEKIWNLPVISDEADRSKQIVAELKSHLETFERIVAFAQDIESELKSVVSTPPSGLSCPCNVTFDPVRFTPQINDLTRDVKETYNDVKDNAIADASAKQKTYVLTAVTYSSDILATKLKHFDSYVIDKTILVRQLQTGDENEEVQLMLERSECINVATLRF
jgi:hypothetical protein